MESLTQLLQKLRDDRHLYDGDSVNRMLDRCIELSKDKGWISASDQMPTLEQRPSLLISGISGDGTPYVRHGKVMSGAFYFTSGMKVWNVTHWMPLPPPPSSQDPA